MNKFKRDEYLVERLWSNKMSQAFSAYGWARNSFKSRNNPVDDGIDHLGLAQKALRDLRVIILDIKMCDIQWENYNLRCPLLVAQELYNTKSNL